MQSALFTVREAATHLGVSEAGVRRWVARGRLRAVRVGRALRIARAELDQIVSRGALDGAEPTGDRAPAPRSPLPRTIRRAEALVAHLAAEDLDHVELVDVLGEALRVASERATERRQLGASEV